MSRCVNETRERLYEQLRKSGADREYAERKTREAAERFKRNVDQGRINPDRKKSN